MDEEFLKEIKEENTEVNANQIVELETEDEMESTSYDIPKVPNNENKNVKKKKKKLTKKQKIILFTVLGIVLVIVISLVVYFCFIKHDKMPKNNEPVVIIEKDNYRYEDGNLIFLDKDKKDIGKYECENKDENLCYVAYYTSEGVFDTDKKVYEDGSSVNIVSDIYLDKYAFVYDNSKKTKGDITLYDMEDKKKLETYDEIKEVKENKVIVKKDKTYGVISLSKQQVETDFKTEYTFIGYIENTDYIVVGDKNNYTLYDFNGKIVSKSIGGLIKNFDSKSISANVGNKCHVYGYDGEEKIDESFDYVTFVDTYIVGITNSKMFIYDSEGNPMNLNGIKVKNTDYNTKLVFNKELRQIDKQEVFSIIINDKTLKLDLKEEKPITINLNEGMLNRSLAYYSYFSGKLYFFADEAKTELLGSFTCSYANSITNGAFTNNCFVAKEENILDSTKENYYLPIYNKRYVFISDTKTPDANDNIILYDLKDNKKLATYKMVDLNLHTEAENVITFMDTSDTLVFAKNTSDSYGVVKITNNKVEGVIPFKDKENNATNVSIKTLKDSLLIKRSDDTFHLYDYKGTELAPQVSTKNEIVDFNDSCIKVVNSAGNYLLYSLDGKVMSSEFKYIAMEKGVYITVDDKNKVGVYSYNGKNSLLESEITVVGKDYKEEVKYSITNNTLTLSCTTAEGVVTEEVEIG